MCPLCSYKHTFTSLRCAGFREASQGGSLAASKAQREKAPQNKEERGSPSQTCDQPRGPEPRTDQLWVKDCALSARAEAEREQTWAKL